MTTRIPGRLPGSRIRRSRSPQLPAAPKPAVARHRRQPSESLRNRAVCHGAMLEAESDRSGRSRVGGPGGPQATIAQGGSRFVLRLDRVEVAHCIAVVLPLLLKDHVQAREGGLLMLGIMRILAQGGQFL